MKLILLSGGSGKRLWPLSNDARSKQFLKVLENDKGEMVSMVQRVWGQLQSAGLSESAYVATGRTQVEMLQAQLGAEVPLIIEPERRDTFPAIALAATYLYSMESARLNEIITILPVDPFVEDRFFYAVKELETVLETSGADLGLIGVRPTYPSTKYGYIVPLSDEPSTLYQRVSHFKEKPTEYQAEELIRQHALWNCGVFAFKLDYMIDLLVEKGLPIQYEALRKQYGQLPKISFDYEVVEKAEHVVVVPYEGDWKDLGTWNTLTEEMGKTIIGNGVICGESKNTHLINELDIPVAVLGLSNVVVAASPDGILVTDKSVSPKVKDWIPFQQTPMYEEKHWGWSRVLDCQRYEDGHGVLTKRIGLAAGKNLAYLMHTNREEVWTVVKGEGEFVMNGNYMRVKPGNVLHIPVKSMHGLKALTDLECIVVQTGAWAAEDEVVEIYSGWDDVMRHCLKM